jgi:hypothetical protein
MLPDLYFLFHILNVDIKFYCILYSHKCICIFYNLKFYFILNEIIKNKSS